MRKNYLSNLTDNQYDAMLAIICDNRKRKRSLKEILDAIFYALKSGCQWRMLPGDFPAWQTVYYYFNKWSRDGTWKKVNDELLGQVRKRVGRKGSPSAGCIDSQSVMGTCRGRDRGLDGGKLVKGRKRHIVTDTQGLLLAVKVHPANHADCKAAMGVLREAKRTHKHLKAIYADGGYRGELIDNVRNELKCKLKITLRNNKSKKFTPLTKRWVVERTFGWFESSRRLSREYEYLPRNEESMIYIAIISLMIR